MSEDFLENLAALKQAHTDITLGHTEETRLHFAACEYAANSVLERPVEKEFKRLAWLCYYEGYKRVILPLRMSNMGDRRLR